MRHRQCDFHDCVNVKEIQTTQAFIYGVMRVRFRSQSLTKSQDLKSHETFQFTFFLELEIKVDSM